MENMIEIDAAAPHSLPSPSADAPATSSDARLTLEFEKLDLKSADVLGGVSLVPPEHATEGTTIAGLVYDGGVILGVGTRALEDGTTVTEINDTQIHRIAQNLFSSGADKKMIASNISLSNLSLPQSESREIVAANRLMDAYLSHQDNNSVAFSDNFEGHGSAALVLGGFDDFTPYLCSILANGSTEKYMFVTMGSGSSASRQKLEARREEIFTRHMTKMDAISLLRDAIAVGTGQDSASDVKLCIIKVGYEGIMRVLDDGFDDCFNNLLQEESALFSTKKLDSGISISKKNGGCFKREGAANITTICIVNPLKYAWEQHKLYIEKMPSEVTVLFVGMNPARNAPSGIPFDDRERIRSILGIDTSALKSPDFLDEPGGCDSAVKFWNLIDARFEADDFRNHCFVINFSPLLIVGSTAKNETLDISLGKLEPDVAKFVHPLIKESQKALEKTIDLLKPELIVPMGVYARTRIGQIPEIAVLPNKVPHPRRWIKEWVSEVLKKLPAGSGEATIGGDQTS